MVNFETRTRSLEKGLWAGSVKQNFCLWTVSVQSLDVWMILKQKYLKQWPLGLCSFRNNSIKSGCFLSLSYLILLPLLTSLMLTTAFCHVPTKAGSADLQGCLGAALHRAVCGLKTTSWAAAGSRSSAMVLEPEPGFQTWPVMAAMSRGRSSLTKLDLNLSPWPILVFLAPLDERTKATLFASLELWKTVVLTAPQANLGVFFLLVA